MLSERSSKLFNVNEKVRAKKHLGQHFLNDKNIAEKIVYSLTSVIPENFPVLEVGPGMGVLTDYLVSSHQNFYAFDVDKESIDFLHKKYSEYQSRIVFSDILHSDNHPLFQNDFSIIGNFPYNISSQIMFKVLEHRNKCRFVVGMFQREVAQRIAEKPGSKTYGILSVLLQAFYQIEYLFTVNENVFTPPPKVKSAVIRLTRNGRTQLNCDEDLFFKVVKTGFNQRRKTLRNALKTMLPENYDITDSLLNKRAEQLSVSDFESLTARISATDLHDNAKSNPE